MEQKFRAVQNGQELTGGSTVHKCMIELTDEARPSVLAEGYLFSSIANKAKTPRLESARV